MSEKSLENALVEERAILIFLTSIDGGKLVNLKRPAAIGDCWKDAARKQLQSEGLL